MLLLELDSLHFLVCKTLYIYCPSYFVGGLEINSHQDYELWNDFTCIVAPHCFVLGFFLVAGEQE